MNAENTKTAKSPAQTDEAFPRPAVGWYVTILMTLVYILSYVDRQILGLLVEPIKNDLQLTDTQIGLLLGAAFALFYTTMGLPLGWLADRVNRTYLLGIGILVWSAATTASGFVRGFGGLFTARVMVGAGEATLGPCAISLISDVTPPHRRARSIAIYFGALGFAAGLSWLIGGQILSWAQNVDMEAIAFLPSTMRPWQLVLVIVGLPGLIFAVLVFALKEPSRKERANAAAAGLDFVPMLRFFGRRSFMLIGLCSLPVAMTIITYSQLFLAPLFERTWGWTPVEFGTINGIMLILIGPLSTFIGGMFVDMLQNRGHADGAFRVMRWGLMIMVPGAIAYPMMPSPVLAVVMLGITTVGMTWLTAASIAAVLAVVPAELRGQGTAVYLMIINIFGLLLGPTLVGVFADQVYGPIYGEQGLRYAMATMPLIFGGAALAIIPLVSRYYGRLLAMRNEI